MTTHKNEEGAYTVQFFDKYGRYVKDNDLIALNFSEAIAEGREHIGVIENATSFLVRRNLYNSVDHL